MRCLSSSLLSKTERQLTFITVRLLEVCLVLGLGFLGLGWFGALGDD